jgi:hypothetical protein
VVRFSSDCLVCASCSPDAKAHNALWHPSHAQSPENVGTHNSCHTCCGLQGVQVTDTRCSIGCIHLKHDATVQQHIGHRYIKGIPTCTSCDELPPISMTEQGHCKDATCPPAIHALSLCTDSCTLKPACCNSPPNVERRRAIGTTTPSWPAFTASSVFVRGCSKQHLNNDH